MNIETDFFLWYTKCVGVDWRKQPILRRVHLYFAVIVVITKMMISKIKKIHSLFMEYWYLNQAFIVRLFVYFFSLSLTLQFWQSIETHSHTLHSITFDFTCKMCVLVSSIISYDCCCCCCCSVFLSMFVNFTSTPWKIHEPIWLEKKKKKYMTVNIMPIKRNFKVTTAAPN